LRRLQLIHRMSELLLPPTVVDRRVGATGSRPIWESRFVRAGRIIGIAAIATALAAPPADATFPGRDGRLAASGPFGCESRTRIVTMRPSGSDRRRITGCSTAHPDWSADGQRMLLFARSALSVMAADGSGLTAVPIAADPPVVGDKPSFAPGGLNLAYTRLQSGRPTVWRTALDGSGDRRLGRGTLPRWSPRGGVIAFAGQRGGIWLMRARDGTLIRRVRAGVSVTSLDWAPGGRRLLYGRRAPDDDVDLFVIRADGTGRKRLTCTPGVEELDAVWSPSGTRIAFVGQRRPNEESRRMSLWMMAANGERRRRIFNGREEHLSEVRSLFISWQPRPG
jgi:Tol biopolymer transport system component